MMVQRPPLGSPAPYNARETIFTILHGGYIYNTCVFLLEVEACRDTVALLQALVTWNKCGLVVVLETGGSVFGAVIFHPPLSL